MTTSRGQKMLKAIEASMKLSTLAPQERAQQEIKLQLTHRVHHILYTEWDPCGVHALKKFDCSDEYGFYLPIIVDMVMDGASVADVSNQLMVFESYMRDRNIQHRCDVIAVMVSHYGPHAARNQFVVHIETDTPQAAYQSVLGLVTQTRLDAYQGQWSKVRQGYEQVVALCQAHLPDRHELHGACLNNLGVACSKIGAQEQALQRYIQALPELEHGVSSDDCNFVFGLNNAINNLQHRRKFAAALPYFERILHLQITKYGWEHQNTWDAKKRMETAKITKRPAPRLHPVNINVERDGCTRIRQKICVD